MKEILLHTSRAKKKLIAISADIFSLLMSMLLSFRLLNFPVLELNLVVIIQMVCITSFSIFIFYRLGVYNSILRFIDFNVFYLLIKAFFLSLVLNYLLVSTINLFLKEYLQVFSYSSTVPLIGWILVVLFSFFGILGSRLFANYFLSNEESNKRVVIYGAGSAGIQLAGALRVSSEMEPIAFLDSNRALQNTFLGGLKVISPEKLHELIEEERVDEILIAIPSASKSTLRNLLKKMEAFSIKVRILPGLAALAEGKVTVSELKEIDITDLLGRYEVEANKDLLNHNIKDKVVLVTGAGGSIGSEITRQVSKLGAKEIIILDANEYGLYKIKHEILSTVPNVNLQSIIASVLNKKRLIEVCNAFNIDTIYHAAAYKHVPLVEENPFEGVRNNIFGTKACLEAAIESEVETFVLISTDKAVRPTNIMGATKRLSEMILQAYSSDPNLKNNTRMTMVRFGNVLGSSGSAIPLFQKQIREGGPVTVTDPEVTRYFMSIPEAAELVIQAGAMGQGGDVFVLDMGESVKIVDLAKRLINLNGFEVKDKNNPNGDIEIIFTGLRAGEKLYEELLIGDKVGKTDHQQILRAEEEFIEKEELERFFEELIEAEKKNDVFALKEIFKIVIHGYE